LFRSEDAGASWEAIDSGTRSSLMGGSSNASGKVSIAGNSGAVIYSQDGGKTFRERIRDDRLGNVSTLFVGPRKVVLVGESGVNLTSPSGQNL